MATLFPAGNTPARDIYTVTRLNREVRVLLERGLGVVWVEGELSNFSAPSSGHWYFSLKDRDAQLRCAMFRQRNQSVDFAPRAGQHVLARGRVSLYEPRGEYQFIIEHLEEAGVGARKRQFERLKAQLAAEGLFATERKRSLPRFPRRIGVITSPTGAAIRDILHILSRRFPPATVLIYPTPVQGDAAIAAVAASIQLASSRAECDVLILARGGGSLEDLWAFNSERVARAVHACKIPIVSGVGHEVDFTIADLVADARAPTPSGAAELVAPDRVACLAELAHTSSRLAACTRRELRALLARFQGAQSRLRVAHPGVRLSQQAQRLDHLEQRLAGAMRSTLQHNRASISELLPRLVQHSPAHLVRERQLRQSALARRLHYALERQLANVSQRLGLAVKGLHACSPLAVLTRGYAVIKGRDGTLLRSSADVALGDEIRAELGHGSLTARVTGKD